MGSTTRGTLGYWDVRSGRRHNGEPKRIRSKDPGTRLPVNQFGVRILARRLTLAHPLRHRSHGVGAMATAEDRTRATSSASSPLADDSSPRTFFEELDAAFIWAGGLFMSFVATAALLLHGQLVYSLVAVAILGFIGYQAHKKYKDYQRPEVLERRRWTDWAIVWGILAAMFSPLVFLAFASNLPHGVLMLASYAVAVVLIVALVRRDRTEKDFVQELKVATENRRKQAAERRRQAEARAEAARQQIEARRRAEDDARKREAEARRRAEEAERTAAAEREREERRARMTGHPAEILERVRVWNPDDVERLVAALWDATPDVVRVKKTPKGPDSGIDVHAEGIDGAGELTRIGIQVKRVKQPIGRPEIQLFRGSLPGGVRGTFITTGTFNENACREARQADKPGGHIELVDGLDLAEWLAARGFRIGRESGEFDSSSRSDS